MSAGGEATGRTGDSEQVWPSMQLQWAPHPSGNLYTFLLFSNNGANWAQPEMLFAAWEPWPGSSALTSYWPALLNKIISFWKQPPRLSNPGSSTE